MTAGWEHEATFARRDLAAAYAWRMTLHSPLALIWEYAVVRRGGLWSVWRKPK